MAIQKAITLDQFGVTLNESYHKIDMIKVQHGLAEVTINTYASLLARRTDAGSPISRRTVNVDYQELLTFEGDELFAKAYNYIKSRFADEYSTDCIDV